MYGFCDTSFGLVAPFTLFVNVEPEILDAAPLTDLLAICDAAPGELRVVLEITERALATRPLNCWPPSIGSASWAGASPWMTWEQTAPLWRSWRCCSPTSSSSTSA